MRKRSGTENHIVAAFPAPFKMSVSAGTTRIITMEGNLNSSFDMDQRDPNNLNNHLQVRIHSNIVVFTYTCKSKAIKES